MHVGQTYRQNDGGDKVYRLVDDDMRVVLVEIPKDYEKTSVLKTFPEVLMIAKPIFESWLEKSDFYECPDPLKRGHSSGLLTGRNLKRTKESFDMERRIWKESGTDILDSETCVKEAERWAGVFGSCERTVRTAVYRYLIGNKTLNGMRFHYDNSGGKDKPKNNKVKPGPRAFHDDGSGPLGGYADVFDEYYKKYCLCPVPKPKKQAFNIMIAERFSNPNGTTKADAPNLNQFYYHTRKLRKQDILKDEIARKGERKGRQDNVIKTSTEDSDALYPMHIVEIDATPLSMECLSSLGDGYSVGKPIAYIAKDVYSRVPVGLYISFENASYASLVECIVNITKNKKEFCAKYGIEIEEADWPSPMKLPQKILVDRGESWNDKVKNLVDVSGTVVDYVEAYRGDRKGIVERGLGKIEDFVRKNLDGSYPNVIPNRGDVVRQNGQAKHPLDNVYKAVILKLLADMKSEVNGYVLTEDQLLDGVIPVPLKLYEYRQDEIFSLDTEASEEDIRRTIMAEKTRSIGKNGTVRLDTMDYVCSDPAYENVLRRLKEEKKGVTVLYSDNDCNTILCRVPEENLEFEMVLPEEKRMSMSRSECRALRRDLDRVKRDYAKQEGNKAVGLMYSEVDKLNRETEAPPKPKASKGRVKKSRKEERELARSPETRPEKTAVPEPVKPKQPKENPARWGLDPEAA